VLGDAGFYFNGDDPDDLRNQLQNLLHQPEIVGKYRRLAQDRAKSHYSWEIGTRDYERLFHQVARKG
jgi:glycosyltransferase involved in cell wall biosynthesis